MAGALPLLGLLTLLSLRTWAAEDAVYQATVERVEDGYLRLDQLDASLAFSKAADAAESAVPWLLVDERRLDDKIEVLLSHGDTGLFATVTFPVDGTLAELPDSLALLEDAIVGRAASGGQAQLPADLDLPVELLRGVSRALDRHSVVLAGDRLDAFNERIRGRLVGIGCRISRQELGLVIRDVFPDGPADRGGLRPEDVIVRVDGISTLGMDLDDVVDRIRGAEGTTVNVEVLRIDPETGGELALSLAFVRDEVRIPNVEWGRTQAGVGWIRIDHFSQQTVRLMERALAELAEAPAVDGLVLDLRGNSGGSMLQAAKTVDLFVDEGLILRTGGRDFARVRGLIREVQAWPPEADSGLPGLAAEAPLVVLMDRSSASASEIVAGALALLQRAVLIGENSHGKGTVQQPFVLREARADAGEVKLKLTIAEYHLSEDTPVLEGIGLTPDVATQPVELSRSGLSLGTEVTQGGALGLVLESPGWRDGAAPPDRGDVLLTLAESIALDAVGPTRAAGLQAASAVLGTWRNAEAALLQAALGARGIDWGADDFCVEPCPSPTLDVQVDLDRQARAGQTVTVRARVENRGPAPLHRVIVRLTAGSTHLPWHGLTVPIGFVPPGEVAAGSVLIELPMISSSREDLVAVTVEADRRPMVGVEPVLLGLVGEAEPPVAVEVRGVEPAVSGALEPDGSLRVEVSVRNDGPVSLTGLQLRFSHPEDPRLEPVERQVVVDRLAPGQLATVQLGLRWSGDQPPTEALLLPLEVEAERFGSLLEVDVPVDWTGSSSSAQPPRLTGDLPLSAPLGELAVSLGASDDRGIESLTAYWRGDKILWRSGSGPELALDLSLELVDGTHALVVDVTDIEGVTTRRRWYVRGSSAGDGMASP